jgi:hypothetical protein
LVGLHCADPWPVGCCCCAGWYNLLESLAGTLVGAGWLYFAGAAAFGSGLILTYAGFRAAPIVPGEQ